MASTLKAAISGQSQDMYFRTIADPYVTSQKDRWPPGSTFDDLIHPQAGNELVSPFPVSWLVPRLLGRLRATENMECIPD